MPFTQQEINELAQIFVKQDGSTPITGEQKIAVIRTNAIYESDNGNLNIQIAKGIEIQSTEVRISGSQSAYISTEGELELSGVGNVEIKSDGEISIEGNPVTLPEEK